MPEAENTPEWPDNIAISGDQMLADSDAGVAVFERNQWGAWINVEHILTPDDCTRGCRFGRFHALDDGTALIGAPDDNVHGNVSGSAYIFEDTGAGWTYVDKLIPDEGADLDRFGWSVAIDKPAAIVGSANGGFAIVYRKAEGKWESEQLLEGDASSEFGIEVAIQGDIVVIGEPHWPGAVGDYIGRALVYQFDGSEWSLLQELYDPDGEASDSFGEAIAISGDWLAVGTGGRQHDRILIYKLTDGQFELTETLTSPYGIVDTGGFGNRLAMHAGMLVTPDHHATEEPVILVYELDGESWTLTQELAEPPGTGPDFGAAVTCYDGMIGVTAHANIVTFGGVATDDCNDNSIPDACDIAQGISEDVNENGVPDECDCPADLFDDDVVNAVDLLIVLENWGTCGDGCDPDDCVGDIVLEDCQVNSADLLALLAAWGPCDP